MEKFGVVSTTLAQRADAERIAEVLLSEKLAACVQLLPIDSRYVWKGQIAREPEILLLAKTRAALFEDVIARIKALHPYVVPQIVATTFDTGHAGYFDWIAQNTPAAF
jgi:uncharacterized protein involved in tolerance to divalent cations